MKQSDDSSVSNSKLGASSVASGTQWKCRPTTPFIDTTDDFGLFEVEPLVTGVTIGDMVDAENAIARRIEACLKVCDGVSIEALEELAADPTAIPRLTVDALAKEKLTQEKGRK